MNNVQLGAGSFGRVYSAQDIDGTYVAIKTLGEKKFGDRVFLAMEFCNMGGLDVTTKKSLMPRASILMQFLKLFHQQGLVHCDIKPANILLTSTDAGIIPKMCDFGETTNIQNIRNVEVFSGTPFFFPPEIGEKRKNYNQGVDIWMLGLTLYMLATGKKSDHPSYGVIRTLGLVLPSELAQFSYTDLNELQLDRNGKNLSETMGKEFVQLLSRMLTYEPSQRHSAAQLLQNFIFTNPRAGNLDIIPNAYGGELGFDVQGPNLLTSRSFVKGEKFTKIELDQPVPRSVYLVKTQQQIKQQFEQQASQIINSFYNPDPYACFDSFVQLSQQSVSFKTQHLVFLLEGDIISKMIPALVRCEVEFMSSSQISQFGQSVYRSRSQGYIEEDKTKKIVQVRQQFSYIILILIEALTETKNGKIRAADLINATPALTDILVGFINPEYYDVQKEYLEVLNAIIDFLAPKEVERLVNEKDLIDRLKQTALVHKKQLPETINFTLKILSTVAVSGINLSREQNSMKITVHSYQLMMQQIAQGLDPTLPETKEHPFLPKCIESGAETNLVLIYDVSAEKLAKYDKVREYKKNPSIYRDPKYDMNLDLSDGTNPEHPEEQLLYTRLACAACIILFHNGRQLLNQHQKAIDTLADEIYPIRLIQSVANSNIREHRAMLEKRLENASIAIVALSYILRLPSNHIYKDIDIITGNLQKYMSLYSAFPNTDVKNALGLLASLLKTASRPDKVDAVINGPIVKQVRELQDRRNELDVIEQLNILDLLQTKQKMRKTHAKQG
ncbi:MAG: hypothetical protein EZS28_012511 [Streblomastix strix]|uniref:Protein kinase domain-containing protein n=1 Tax=Streblomastix strix TaxID=222440 RepID=A0A5J4WBB4_9EUKA|nr:MAG: hypothetical protein EZS28_012511 [Streblomastix strix]